MAAELSQALQGKTILGLVADTGIPARPHGPAIACRVKLKAAKPLVQVSAVTRPPELGCVRQVQPPVAHVQDKFDALRFADGMAEGILNRLVRAQVIKGATGIRAS